MTGITFRSGVDVTLIRSMANDDYVVQSAKVSTLGTSSLDSVASDGFIGFLMKNRHGSPLESCLFTWMVSAPIFVWREVMRHRIASYNEESGRYKQLEPVFYLPGEGRNLRQVGKPGHYEFVPGSPEELKLVRQAHATQAKLAYETYQILLDAGIAKEVARMSLPLNIYSSAYITMNARALMNFLSLRTKDDSSLFPSFPQREIEMVAEKMEQDFTKLMPITAKWFRECGRVAP